MLDTKIDKEEFSNFVSMLTENTIHPMQKEIDKCKKDIVCIEVSYLSSLTIFYCGFSHSLKIFLKLSKL